MTTSDQFNPPSFDDMARQVQATASSLQPWIDQAMAVIGQAADAIANIPLIHWAKGIPGLSWLLAALGQVDEERIQQEVAELRRRYPLDTSAELVQRIVTESAWRGAQVGLVTNVIPPVALALFAVDIGAIAALQAQMIYRIATVYGFSPKDTTRRGEVIALWFFTSSGSNLIKTSLTLPELLPGIGAAVGIATDASLLYTVGWLASQFYATKQKESLA